MTAGTSRAATATACWANRAVDEAGKQLNKDEKPEQSLANDTQYSTYKWLRCRVTASAKVLLTACIFSTDLMPEGMHKNKKVR